MQRKNIGISKIVLVGYMGSGKTTVGGFLAQRLGVPFVDLDHYLERKQGRSVREIFESDGEDYFRTRESEALRELLASEEDFVLALGGGTPCFNGNMDFIGQEAVFSVYLCAGVDELTRRLIRGREKRPLIAGKSDEELRRFIASTLSQREAYYRKAHLVISVEGKTNPGIADEILSKV